MSEIELKHVSKTYENGFEAIKDFNLKVKDGEFIIFVGPSGCGKSTVLRMIAGLEEISGGELLIDGERMNDVDASKRNIAMVFQNYALYPHMSVYKNIGYSLKIHKVPKAEMDRKIRETAEILGLTEVLDRRPGQLSGGQRQRVAMGRAIVRNPRVFLMDEPLSNLDAKLRGQMRVEIARLYHQLKGTFIYVTHDQTEAMTLGTRIVVLKAGDIQQVDTPQNLYHYPVNRFVAGFIGTPPMNFIDGTVMKNGTEISIIAPGLTIIVREAKAQKLVDGGYIGKTVTVGIRPEHVSLKKTSESDAGGSTGTVDVYEMLGDVAEAHVTCEDLPGTITAKFSSEETLSAGDRVALSLELDKIHLFDRETGVTISN